MFLKTSMRAQCMKAIARPKWIGDTTLRPNIRSWNYWKGTSNTWRDASAFPGTAQIVRHSNIVHEEGRRRSMSLVGAVTRLVPAARASTRSFAVVSGPPRNKISTGELVVHFSLLCAGLMAVPAWVLVNIKHYRGDLQE